MATTSGYVEIGSGKAITTWRDLIADLADLDGDLTVMQTSPIADTGTASKSINLNGHTLTFDSSVQHGGVVGGGNPITISSQVSADVLRLQVTGSGTFIIKNLHVDLSSISPSTTSMYGMTFVASDDADIIARNLLAIGNPSASFNRYGVQITTYDGHIDASNITAAFWKGTGAEIASGYGAGDLLMENCTFYGNTQEGWYNWASFAAGGGIVRNCASAGNGLSDFGNATLGGHAGYNNASEDGTAATWSAGGSGNQTGITPASEFKSLSTASSDFLMIADGSTVLKAGGTSVSITGNTTGIRGTVRPHDSTLYSIGADEYGNEFPAPPTPPASSSSSSSAAPVLRVTEEGDAKGTNLGRALLINIDGASATDTAAFGYEYISPTYRPVELPSGLLNVRRMLFGSAPDLEGLNYSVWQYMRVLHSTEFEAYITALDPRITYLNNKSLVDYPYGPNVSENHDALQFVGTPDLGGASGRLTERWRIEQSGSSFRIYNYRTNKAVSHVPAITDGATDYMPMTGHPNLKVRVLLGYADRSAWEVAYLAKPTSAMDPVNRAAQLSSLSAEAYLELFPRRDPYNLFRELWERHQEFAYKLSGVLLALIYRTQEIRVSG